MLGNVFREKCVLLRRLNGIQKVVDYGCNPFLDDLESKLKRELEDLLKAE